jgi:hypothetical protein
MNIFEKSKLNPVFESIPPQGDYDPFDDCEIIFNSSPWLKNAPQPSFPTFEEHEFVNEGFKQQDINYESESIDNMDILSEINKYKRTIELIGQTYDNPTTHKKNKK